MVSPKVFDRMIQDADAAPEWHVSHSGMYIWVLGTAGASGFGKPAATMKGDDGR